MKYINNFWLCVSMFVLKNIMRILILAAHRVSHFSRYLEFLCKYWNSYPHHYIAKHYDV